MLGEAVKHIPEEVKEKYSGIEWRKIREFRNFVTHAYFKVDPDILWDVVSQKIPDLSKRLKDIKIN